MGCQCVNEPKVSKRSLAMITIRYNGPLFRLWISLNRRLICVGICIQVGNFCTGSPMLSLLSTRIWQCLPSLRRPWEWFGTRRLFRSNHIDYPYLSIFTVLFTVCQFLNWHVPWVLRWSRCESVDVERHQRVPVQPTRRLTSNKPLESIWPIGSTNLGV